MREFEGQRTYHCGLCLDDGLITVWSFLSMKAARNRERVPRYSQGVRCNCRAGKRYPWLKVFYDARMVACEYHPTDEDLAVLMEFIENEKSGQEWNGGDSFPSYSDVVNGTAGEF